MKKWIILFSLLFLITGCTSYTELNQMAVVDMIGITKQDNIYHLYLTIIQPKKEENTTTDRHKVYEVTGKSLGEIFEQANHLNNKITYYKHLSILVLDEDLIQQDSQIMISFLKEKFTQINYILICSPTVKELIETYPNHQTIEQFIKKEQTEDGSIIPITFDQLYASYLDDQQLAYLPTLSLENEKIIVEGMTKLDTLKTLSKDEARLHYLLTNDITNFNLPILYQDTSYEILFSHLKSSITYQNQTLHISITGMLDSDDVDKNSRKKIEKIWEEKLAKDSKDFIVKEQEAKTTTTSMINTIYLKVRDKKKAVEAFEKAHLDIKVQLKWKGENIYDA